MNWDGLSMEIHAFQPWLVVTWCNTGRRCKLSGKGYWSRWASCLSFAVPRVRYALSSHVPWEWRAKWVVNFIWSSIKCLRPIANKYYEGRMQRILKKSSKKLGDAGRERELDQFCFVRLAHGAGIHVSVCVVACFVCQNQFICELNSLRRSHWVCSRIWGFTNGLRSNGKLLKWQFIVVVRFLAFVSDFMVSFDPSWNTDQGV